MPKPTVSDEQIAEAVRKGWPMDRITEELKVGWRRIAKIKNTILEYPKTHPATPALLPVIEGKREANVAELCELYRTEAVPSQGKQDRLRSEFAIDALVERFGALPVSKFRATEVDALGRHFGTIRKRNRKTGRRDGDHLSHRYVRKLMGCVRHAWNWLALRDLVTAEQAALVALAVSRGANYGAPNKPRVKPLKPEACAKILAHCKPVIRDMAKLQILTGMRTGELLAISADQIDRTVTPWVYEPRQHKNLHRGKDRRIYLSAEAQSILTPYLAPPCFHFHRNTYDVSLKRAAAKAGLGPVRAYQLRHVAATEARIAHGDDFAAKLLGHAGKGLLERYAGTAEEERQRRAG